jgi:hypothetical protein
MATVTPVYNWPVPTSTDYVKDGATAIESLGDAIDSSLNSITSGKNVGLPLIGTTTFSGASTVNVNDVFSASFKSYKIKFQLTTAANPTMRFRVAGADNSSALYHYTHWYSDSGGASGVATFAANATSIATRAGFYDFILQNPFESVLTAAYGTYIATYGSINSVGTFGANFNNTTSFTGFSILGSAMTGTVSVYGIKE